MIQYLDLLRHVMEHGKFKADCAGTGTYSVFGARTRFPLLFDLGEFGNGRSVTPIGPRLQTSKHGIDQIASVIEEIKTNPVSDNELTCQVYQRSADVFLSMPFICHITAHYQMTFSSIYRGFPAVDVVIALSQFGEVKNGCGTGNSWDSSPLLRQGKPNSFHLN